MQPMADWEARMEFALALELFDRMTIEEWQAFVFPDLEKGEALLKSHRPSGQLLRNVT